MVDARAAIGLVRQAHEVRCDRAFVRAGLECKAEDGLRGGPQFAREFGGCLEPLCG